MDRIKKTSKISKNDTEIDLSQINLHQDNISKNVTEDDNEKSVNVNIINKSSKISEIFSGGAKDAKKSNVKSKSAKTMDNIANEDNSRTNEKNEQIDPEQKIKNSFQSTLLHSPYIETSLRCPIMLNPTQMDNKLELYLKANLNNYTKGRCFLNYGYVVKINKIEETSDGRIEEEDSSCSAKFIVKFSCRLCLPAKNREIICKIDRMNKALISGINGPIKAIITPDKINKENFFTDTDRNIRIKSSSALLEPEMYIRVLILQSTFSHYDTNIIAISFLQNIATEQEIKMFEKEQYYNQN